MKLKNYKTIKIISDYRLEELSGSAGAEYNDQIIYELLKDRDHDVEICKSIGVTVKFLKALKKNTKFIVSNFIFLNEQSKQYIINNFDYCIWEHDHKYLKGRNPARFLNFEAPKEYIINKEFYEKAKFVFCQTEYHKKIIEKNLKIKNIVNLSGNFWSESDLLFIENLSATVEKNKGVSSVMESEMASKNTQGTIDYCNKNNIKYELISDSDYHQFLKKMSKNEKLIFLPTTPETLSRICVEAKMIGVKVTTNALVGCKYEKWFKEDNKDVINYFRKFRKETIDFVLREL